MLTLEVLEDDRCKYMDFFFHWSEFISESNPEFQKMGENLENEIIETHMVHNTSFICVVL